MGKDGPTHQPIEQLAQLRLIPNLNVFRPCDGNEMLAAYKHYLENEGPTAIVFSRQELGVCDGKFKDSQFGGYILKHAQKEADIVIYASGSEVALALNVYEELEKRYDVSIVSMPSIDTFEKQSASYKNKVLQPAAKLKVAIEASNDNIWYKYIGNDGIIINVKDYQTSADGKEVYTRAGFNTRDIVRKISKVLVK